MMKFCLPFMLAFAAATSPLFAQQQLPDRFFLECKSDYNGDTLVLVDRTKKTFFIKIPFLDERKFKDTPDGLIGDGAYPIILNKWDGSFRHLSSTYRTCEYLDPDSRQPLFK